MVIVMLWNWKFIFKCKFDNYLSVAPEPEDDSFESQAKRRKLARKRAQEIAARAVI